MKENIIYLPSFQGKYKTGLIFSMIEGLNAGKDLKIFCEQSPTDLEKLLQEAGLPNVSWSSRNSDKNQWELSIHKENSLNSDSVGCCGLCGDNKT